MGQGLQRQRLVFYISVGFLDERTGLYKVKETEPLGQFHQGTGFGLFRGPPFAHLFLSPDDPDRILSAATDKNRDTQSPAVNTDGLL